MADNDDQDIEARRRLAAQERRARDFDDLGNEQAGRDTGRRQRFLTTADHTDGADGREDDRRSGSRDLSFYLDLIATGGFAGHIADEIFDTKGDAEIADIVGRIEAKTGKSFKDYAAGILGPEGAKRLPDESDADYRRRILKALTEKILDPRTGRVKPEYADDPLAAIIVSEAAYQRIMEDTARVDYAGSGPEAEALVEGLKSAGYESAELAAHHVESDLHKGSLREGQDGHSDVDLNTDNAVARNDSFFGTPSRIRQAAEAGRAEFNDKASETGPADRILTATRGPGPSSGTKV